MIARPVGISRMLVWLMLAIAGPAGALLAAEPAHPPLAGSEPLEGDANFADQLVSGADKLLLELTQQSIARRGDHWHRDFSSPSAYATSIGPNRARLAKMVGLVDPRVTPPAMELDGTTDRPALVAKGPGYDVFAVTWPAFADVHGAGLLLVPTGRQAVADVVAIPDCGTTPEQLAGLTPGVPAESQLARSLAENGCRVVVPMLINREGHPDPIRIYFAKDVFLDNRDWSQRQAFEMGRTLIGYEVQKVLAAIDWFAADGSGKKKIGVIGWGEGGLLALYAGALDSRIAAVSTSGYFDNRNDLWQEPIDRNIFGLLTQFGDAELASLIAPRKLIVEAAKAPEAATGMLNGPRGRIVTPELTRVEQEVRRASKLVAPLDSAAGPALVVTAAVENRPAGSGAYGSAAALKAFLAALDPSADLAPPAAPAELSAALPDPKIRHEAQLHELDRFSQSLIAGGKYVRQKFVWDKLNYESPEKYAESIIPLRRYFAEEVIGRCDAPRPPLHPRTRFVEETVRYTRYEVVLDALPGVIAYGLVTIPKNIPADERRPVVVCQHGIDGRPQDVIGEPKSQYYEAFASRLAEHGFITFAPQNLYIFRDRYHPVVRKAHPLKMTHYSIMIVQNQAIIDWLKTLPEVAPDKIAYYGLSYGGKTAMRIPAILTDYCLSICSGDFNDWVAKHASILYPFSHLHSPGFETYEFDIGGTFSYAEMAALIAPRPFMVERGHFDGVASDDAVGAEYAKVQHLYAARLNLPERTAIEWLAGPHKVHLQESIPFLQRQLHFFGPKPN